MTDSYSMQSSLATHTCGSHVNSRILEIKHHVHTIKFYRNWLRFVGDGSVLLAATLCKAVWLELHVGPRQEPNPRNKTSRSHYKILSKLTEIFLRRLSMTGSYSVQNSMARRTCGPHTKSWTPEIKPRVHTIDFYQNWLNFFWNDSVWLVATLCKTV